MLRRHRRTVSFAAVLLVTVAAAYGCGVDATGEDVPKDSDAATPEGSTPGVDGASPGDGSTPTDGAGGDASGDGASDAGDAGDSGDAALDAPLDADADADAGVVDPPGPLAPDYVDHEVNHILSTGQSNAVASGARPQNTLPLNTTAFTAAQPYTNLMFDTGVMTARNCNGSGCPAANYVNPAAFTDLIESDGFFSGDRVETASSAMANEASYLALNTLEFGVRPGYPVKHDVLVSLHGRSGNTYWCLRKGGCSYKPASEIKAFDEAIKQVEAGKALAMAAGKSYVVRAVTTIHGESDHYGYQDFGDNHPEFPLPGTDGVPNKIQEYDDALIEWQADYEAMAKGITGQAQAVPLFFTGLSGWTGARTSKLANLQLSAAVRAPTKVIYVAPGYIFEGAVKAGGALECLHYSLLGEQHIGEYFAKAYAHVVLQGKAWSPLRPLQVTRAANVVTVKFHVPVPPLEIDTTHVAAIQNYGFDFVDNGALATINSVVVSAPDTVTITLAAAPSGGAMRLRYAQNQPVPGCIGPGVKAAGGARGNLRDSDPAPSRLGFTLYNWGVNFDVAVP